jgi:hypothetical protein
VGDGGRAESSATTTETIRISATEAATARGFERVTAVIRV